MTPSDFLAIVKAQVRDRAVADCLRGFAAAPSLCRDEQAELAGWFQSQSEADRRRVDLVVRDAADRAVYLFLQLLNAKGFLSGAQFDLSEVTSEGRVRLNPPDAESLDDLYDATYWVWEKEA